MTTVVVYKTDTKEVLAAIPMDGGDAVCRNDVEFQIYNGTEPIFTETPGGIVLAENKFMIKMEGNNNENKGTWIIVGIVAAFVLLIAGIFVSTNNRAVSLEEQVFTADSDIQAQEKRRTDLIYNLADCVKEYDKHEAETLLNVVEARGNNGSTTDIENVTTSIAAVAEAYPELKSNENYKELMNELSTTENMILQYRTAYNNEVRAYKKYVRKFPHKQILGVMGYEVINYDYLEYSEEDRQPVSNLFGE